MRRTGSPPRVRGTVVSRRNGLDGYRITPARAGNSIPLLKNHKCVWDHPRACGEQLPDRIPSLPFGGSPPRVRGTDFLAVKVAIPYGITPARAGNRIFLFWMMDLM